LGPGIQHNLQFYLHAMLFLFYLTLHGASSWGTQMGLEPLC
jgi:hypothetical protein